MWCLEGGSSPSYRALHSSPVQLNCQPCGFVLIETAQVIATRCLEDAAAAVDSSLIPLRSYPLPHSSLSTPSLVPVPVPVTVPDDPVPVPASKWNRYIKANTWGPSASTSASHAVLPRLREARGQGERRARQQREGAEGGRAVADRCC
jgi:hypothetical protein